MTTHRIEDELIMESSGHVEYMDTEESLQEYQYEHNFQYLTGDRKDVVLLNLTAKYAQSWGLWEGVREFIQNWHDGIFDASDQISKQQFFVGLQKVEFNIMVDDDDIVIYQAIVSSRSTKPEVFGYLEYSAVQQRLTLVNHKTALEKKILLLGYSSHSRHKDVIGQFGEGLKIGALALIRKGMGVTMETNKEGWRFILHPYEHFDNEKGLAVLITKPEELPFNQKNQMNNDHYQLAEGDTLLSIYPLPAEEFQKCRRRFLFLTPPVDSVQTDIGTLLLDDRFAGQLYVKGSWVSDLKDDNLNTGVDFCELKIDRDRNAVPQLSEIDHKVSCMWPRALEQRRDLAHRYYSMLANNPNCRDVKHASTYAVNETTAALMAEQFKVQNADAFPVMDSFAWQELQGLQDELQRKVVSCNQALLNLLHKSGRYATLDEARAAMKAKKSDVKPFSTLSPDERNTLKHAVKLANLVDPKLKISMIDIINTPDEEKPTMQGERIEIPTWMLDQEVVHKSGNLCSPSSGRCMCREIRICNTFLVLRRDHIEGRPGRHMREPPLEQIFMKILSKYICRECERAPKHIKQGQVSQSDVHASCMETQESLKREIKRIETEQKQAEQMHADERARLARECEVVKNELEGNLKEPPPDEKIEDLRKEYQSQMERIQEKFERELQQKDRVRLQRENAVHSKMQQLQEANRRIDDQEREIQNYTKELDHRHTVMVEKVVLYRTRLNEQANNIKKAKTTKDKGFTESSCKDVAAICESICQDLQGQAYICCVCKTSKRSYAFKPCLHYKYCEPCAKTVSSGSEPKCAFCREKCTGIFKVLE